MPNPARVLLSIAAGVVALQASVFVALAIADFAGLAPDRTSVGIGIGLVLLILGVGLLLAAVGLFRAQSWARGPVVVAQLIGLLLAWNLRNPDPDTGDNRFVGALIAASAVIVLLCVAAKPARRRLALDDPGSGPV